VASRLALTPRRPERAGRGAPAPCPCCRTSHNARRSAPRCGAGSPP